MVLLTPADSVDVVARALALELSRHRALVPVRAALVLDVVDAAGARHVRTILVDEDVRVAAGEVPLPGAAEARLAGRLNDLLDVLGGRAPAAAALRDGGLTVSGRREVLAALSAAFRARQSPLSVRMPARPR